MKKIVVGLGFLLSGTVGMTGILIASAIGGSYGSARSIMHINLETLFLFFGLLFVVGFIYSYMGMKESA